MIDPPELPITRENAPERLHELQAQRESLPKDDPQLLRLNAYIALIEEYLKV
jgi:hypothetical protein